jgi:small subunit ribosomal protein S2
MTKTLYLDQLYKDLINLTKLESKEKKHKFFDCGVHLGHKSLKLKSAWHCSVSTFLLGSRNSSAIFKSKQTLTCFLTAFYILTLIIKGKGKILIINTNPEFSKLLSHTKKNANSSQIFYSDCDWVGGTLTNWAQISQSVNTFINFYHKFDDFLLKNNIHFPRYKKIKKSFRGFINTERKKPNINLSSQMEGNHHSAFQTRAKKAFCESKKGSQSLLKSSLSLANKCKIKKEITFLAHNWKPDLLFILDSNNTEGIIKEASKLQIPIVALIDSNTNISNITYPIPTNNNSFVFAWFCLDWITRTINTYSSSKSKSLIL